MGLGYARILSLYEGNPGYKFSGFGPVFASYERAITDQFGVGVALSYSSYGAKWVASTYDYSYRWTSLSVMLRGAYHFSVRNDKFDPYAGIGLGYLNNNGSWTSSLPGFNEALYKISLASPFAFQIFGGARYMFTEKFGGYAEVGYGISVANFGLTFKL